MPNTQELVLLYYPSPEASRAKGVFLQQKIRIRPVITEELGMAVGFLAGIRADSQATGAMEPPESPTEPVMVFSGLSSRRLDGVLAALRKAGVPRSVYKAVVTAENASWPFSALCAELIREREAVERGG